MEGAAAWGAARTFVDARNEAYLKLETEYAAENRRRELAAVARTNASKVAKRALRRIAAS